MCGEVAPQEDRTSALTAPRSPWRVTAVKALESFALWVEFQDGTAGSVEMREFVHAADAGVSTGLADPVRFAEV